MVSALIKSMRPRQWTKNAFILAAVIFDRQLTQINSIFRTFAGLLIFCLLSSSVYLINDVLDIKSDRKHPTKKFRPIASGNLPISTALLFALIFIFISITCAYLLSMEFALICLVYFLVNLVYSKWLKHVVILDVIILASGFVLRVLAGVSLIHVERFSPWLYVVTTLLALYLGFGKRRAELTLSSENASLHRKVLNGYTIPLLDQLITVVSSSTIIAYSFYTFSAPNLPTDHTMMLTIPFVMYAIFRYLYLIQVDQAGGAPEELLLTDKPIQLSILLYAISVFLIFYSPALANLFG